MRAEIEALEREIFERKQRLAELRRAWREPVDDHVLQTADGPRPLSAFFGDKDELILIHNMGRSCPYCTLWADGMTGFTRHIRSRAGFVLVSADDAETAGAFSKERGWNFPVAGDPDGSFRKAMGMAQEDDGSPMPGVSAFTRDAEGALYRHGYTYLGPGDDFCSIWHLWDLLPAGENGWSPR